MQTLLLLLYARATKCAPACEECELAERARDALVRRGMVALVSLASTGASLLDLIGCVRHRATDSGGCVSCEHSLVLSSRGRLCEAQGDLQWRLLVQRLLLLLMRGEVVACVRGARGCRWGKRCAHEKRSVGAGVSCEHWCLPLLVGCARQCGLQWR